MKLRYYLRGLGTGIVVTALILIIASGDKEALSDAEIKERAAGLGMVESSSLTLADIQDNKAQDSPEVQEAQSQEAQEQQEQTTQQESAESQESSEAQESQAQESTEPQESQAQESTEPQEAQAQESTEPQENQNVGETANQQPAEEPTTENTNTENTNTEASTTEASTTEAVLITVESGASSYTVSKLLEAAGLVEDAREFDTYLCNNGYSRSIRVGKHEIPGNATWEEMAKIISGKQ